MQVHIIAGGRTHLVQMAEIPLVGDEIQITVPGAQPPPHIITMRRWKVGPSGQVEVELHC